jgi:hypothetical protein
VDCVTTYALNRIRCSEHASVGSVIGPGLSSPLYSLEDVVREVEGQPVASWKIPGKTAIPSGRYRLRWTMSSRFKRMMLLLEDVPGFAGIRIHPLNRASESEGCIGLGKSWTISGGEEAILKSVEAVKQFEALVVPKITAGEAVYLEVDL